LPTIGEEIRYDSQENFSEVATEIQIEESFFEATESFDNQGPVEGIQEIASFFAEEPISQSPGESESPADFESVNEPRPVEEETVATSERTERPTMGRSDEQESSSNREAGSEGTRAEIQEESNVQNDTAPIEDDRVVEQPQEEDRVVAEEEVSNETVRETEARDSNDGDETTEVADSSREDNQSTPDSIEESRSEGTTRRPAETVSIENIEKKVNEKIKRVDQRLIATSIIAAKAMQSKISVDNYGNTNSEMFNSQPQMDGGDYYETRQYIDARNLYAQNQNVYDDPVTRFQKNVQEKVDERIRAEEHLRRIRGY